MKNVPIFQKIFQHMFTNEIEEDLIMFSVFSQQEPNNFILSKSKERASDFSKS